MRRQKTTEATKARRLQAKEDAATERRQRKDLEAEKEAAMYPSDEADRLQAEQDAATMQRQKTTEARRQQLEKESSAQPVAAAGEQGDNITPRQRRALVAQINARRSTKPRKDKNESDHPSLTKDAKTCLRSTWLDGEVWLSDDRLRLLLCQLLDEAAEKTDRKPRSREEWLVAIQDWEKVASELTNWTKGANKGPATEMGSFQLALAKERTVESKTGPITQNIIAHWMSILLSGANDDIAQKKYSFYDCIIHVHRPAVIDYIKSINHELARRNSNSSKKTAPGREQWYVVSATTLAAWNTCQATYPVAEEAAGHGGMQHQPQSRAKAPAKKKDVEKQKEDAENDTVSEKLERVTEARQCAETGVILYHCRWVGFTPDDDTWEPRENISENPEFLKFLKGHVIGTSRKEPIKKAARKKPIKKASRVPENLEFQNPELHGDCAVCSKTIKDGEAWECAKCCEQMHAPGTESKRLKKACTKISKESCLFGPFCLNCWSRWGSNCVATSEAARKKLNKKAAKRAALHPEFQEFQAAKRAGSQQQPPTPGAEPDREAKDRSYLQKDSEIWVEYYDKHDELKWFKGTVVIVSPTSEVPSASVVRVHFLDGQKVNLNLRCSPDSDKLEKHNPKKYEQFDWSTSTLSTSTLHPVTSYWSDRSETSFLPWTSTPGNSSFPWLPGNSR